jgi:hypothetical protein
MSESMSSEGGTPAEEEQDNTLMLDEKDEAYGYAVYNVRRKCFIPKLGSGRMGVDKAVFSEEEVIEHYQNIDEDTKSHLRIVEVSLNNEIDAKAAGVKLNPDEEETNTDSTDNE